MSDTSYNSHRQIRMSLLLLARKLRKKHISRRIAYRAYGYTVWLFLHIILYIIGPFKLVKVVLLWSDRIGHLAYNTDVFLRQLALRGSEGRRVFYLGIASNPAANQQLLTMYKRKFFITQNKLAHALLSPLYVTKSSPLFENLYLLNDTNYPYYKLDNTKPSLYFTPSEEEKGKEILHQMGMDDTSWFICFHARDRVYLSNLLRSLDTTYHNYRDCDVKNYLEAAKYIVSCGGFAVRMGHLVAEKLPDLQEPRIIDYASDYRSDFGDIYLAAKAKFFLGNTAGIFLVATILGVPVALTNFAPLEELTPFRTGDLFIPKKIWSIDKKRFLTFREILESGVGRYLRGEEYARAGLEAIENTAQEILDLAIEMNERLDGTFESTEEDEELQKAFHSLFQPHHYCYGTPVRIGAKFLRENKELLE